MYQYSRNASDQCEMFPIHRHQEEEEEEEEEMMMVVEKEDLRP
jgi:hypothetical protein